MIRKIGHIGIAVQNLEEGIKLYRDVYGLSLLEIEEVSDQKVKVAIFEVGDVHIELLEPTSEDSPIAKHLDKRGPGLHHLCFNVDDVDASLKVMDDKGVRLIDHESRPGASGTRVGFLHPKATAGVLTELNSKA